MKHWVIVTDAGSCRIFETDEAMEAWTPLQRVVHKEGQLPPGHHAAPHEIVERKFAHEVAGQMNAAFARGGWERAVLVAPPRFLGEVLVALSEQAARAVVASIPHDFARLSEHELPAAVRRHMPELAGLELERG